jgi:hypothetical protein
MGEDHALGLKDSRSSVLMYVDCAPRGSACSGCAAEWPRAWPRCSDKCLG